jgi:hypothetical protein
MSYTESQLSAKTEKQLREILLKEFPLVVVGDMATKQELIDSILDQQPMADSPSVEETPADPNAEFVLPTEKRWRLTVHGQEGVENTPFIKVQVNGRVVQINRNVEVEVPDWVKTALEDAIATISRQDPDTGVMTYMDVRRFPFTIHGPATA